MVNLAATAFVIGMFCVSVGTMSHAEEETRFFRVEETDAKWTLRDSKGRPFYMRSVNRYGDGSGMPWNLEEKHDSVAAWRASLRDRVGDWGFNYLPPSMGPTAINPATVPKPHGRHNLSGGLRNGHRSSTPN